MDIIATRGRAGGYQLAHRSSRLPELKLLVDAVQSSKFSPSKKPSLSASWRASRLPLGGPEPAAGVRPVGRVKKSMNESIYYPASTPSIRPFHRTGRLRSVILNGLWKKPCATAGTASTSARLTRWCGTMRTIILWPTTTQRRRRASAITAWTKWRICPFWKSPGWARGDIRMLRHGAVRQTDVRDVRRCAAGRGAAVRRAAGRRGADRFGKRRSHCCPTAAAFSGACRPSSAPVHGLWLASARTQSCLGRLPWCGNTPPSAGRCSRSTNKR